MKEKSKRLHTKLIKNKKIVLSFVLNLIFLALFQFICEVHFASENDQFLNNVFAGTFAENSSGYGLTHILVGFIFKNLYSLIPQVTWYALFQYFCVFLCLNIIVYTISIYFSHWGAYLINIFLLIILGYECYARVSYVKTGVLCLLTACFILIQAFNKKTLTQNYLVISILLFFIGYLWWNKAVLIGISIMLIPCVYKGFMEKRNKEKKSYRAIVLTVIVMLLGTATLETINIVYINLHHELKEQLSYINLSQAVNRYGLPEYSVYQSNYEELGITENTYLLLKDGNTIDSSLVSLEALKKLKEMVKPQVLTPLFILDYTRTYPLHYFDTGLFYGFLVFIFLFFLSSTKYKKAKIIYIFGIIWIIYLICYLYGIDNDNSITTSIWLAAIILLLGLIDNFSIENKELRIYYSFLLSIVLLISVNNQYADIITVTDLKSVEKTKNRIELINSDNENIYITDSTDFYMNSKPFDNLEKGLYNNLLSTKNQNMLYNSQNIMHVILEKTNHVRFLSEELSNEVTAFLNERYYNDCFSVCVGQLDDIYIYMIRKGRIDLDTNSIQISDSNIINNIKLSNDENGKITIEGYIYKRNTNSFTQKVYLEQHNIIENTYNYSDVWQSYNTDKDDIMDGKFSYVYAESEVDEHSEYSVILEIESTLYRLPIKTIG